MKFGLNSSLTSDLFKRERDIEKSRLIFPRKHQVTSDFIQRLGLEKELEGHNGCVNCLEWNRSGNILASGSDDFHVIIWDPLNYSKLSTLKTSHQGNIFSVKFLPSSNDTILVTGAADNCVSLQDIERGQTLTTYKCHLGRVKRLATTYSEPHMIWSIGEDGVVMQYDTRQPAHQHGSECPHVLLNLNTFMGPSAEGKCLNLNPVRPELMAVGCNDPYVRLYDRRMLTPRTIKYPDNWSSYSTWDKQNLFALIGTQNPAQFDIPHKACRYFISGHIPFRVSEYRKRYRTLACTYVAFSPDGSELLANLGGEQIYLFDVSSATMCAGGDRSYAQLLTLRSSADRSVGEPAKASAISGEVSENDELAVTTATTQRLKLAFNNIDEGVDPNQNLMNKKLKKDNGFLPHEPATIPEDATSKLAADPPSLTPASPSTNSRSFHQPNASLKNGHNGIHQTRYEALICDLFELSVANPPRALELPPPRPVLTSEDQGQALEPLAELLKRKANHIFEQRKYTEAISLYNRAIALNPRSPLLLGNRAAALMKREWDGDIYAAMRDCLRALELDPSHLKARFRMIRCLLHLDKVPEAMACLERFRQKFPEYAASGACKSLESEIAFKEFHDKAPPSKEEFTPFQTVSDFDAADLSPMSQTFVDFLRDPDQMDQLIDDASRRFPENPEPASQPDSLAETSRSTRLSSRRRLQLELESLDTFGSGEEAYPSLNYRENGEPTPEPTAGSAASSRAKFKIPAKERAWKKASRDYSRRFCGHCNTTTDIKEANFFGSDGQYIVAGSDDGYFFIWERATTNICRVLLADDSIVNCLQPHPSTCLLATSGIDPVIRLWSPRPENNKEEREVTDLNDAAAANQKRMNADPIEVMLMNMGYRVNNSAGSASSPEGSVDHAGSSDAARSGGGGNQQRSGLFRSGPDISSTTVHCRTN